MTATPSSSGTIVELRLRDELLKDGIDTFVMRLVNYVRSTVSRVPCPLEIRSHTSDSIFRIPRPGWKPLAMIAEQLTSRDFGIRLEEVSENWLGRSVRRIDSGSRLWERVKEALRYDFSLEGTIPAANVSYRISICSFDNANGRSISFFVDDLVFETSPGDDRYFSARSEDTENNSIRLHPDIAFSVNGFNSRPYFPLAAAISAFPLVNVEVDFWRYQSLAVGRESFTIDEEQAFIVNRTIRRAAEVALKHYTEKMASDTTLLHDAGLILGAYPGICMARPLSISRSDASGRLLSKRDNKTQEPPVATINARVRYKQTTERTTYR